MFDYHQIIKKYNVMLPKEINQQPITSFLASIGIYPERKFNGYWIYRSLVNTNQLTGSLKVSASNLWVDYSLNNAGGTLIDLILLIYPNFTVKEIVKRFNSGVFSFHQLSNSMAIEKKNDKEGVIILDEYDIYKKSYLRDYLQKDRGVTNLEMCNRYLKTIHYKSVVSGKEFWNLGCRNFNSGYNMFSKGFKSATLQGFTFFENAGTTSMIYFEGIIDFLSFLMIYPDQEFLHDYCILNSVNNLKKSLDINLLKNHIVGCLDNDTAGDKATNLLKKVTKERGLKFSDMRNRFEGFKDLNEFLLSRKFC